MKIKSLFVTAGVILLSLVSCGHTTSEPEGKKQKIWTYSMNKICKEWDGQWQGIKIASDGNCYFGSSTHSKSHGRYDRDLWRVRFARLSTAG